MLKNDTDINIRIDRRTHVEIKQRALKKGMNIKLYLNWFFNKNA